MNDVILHTFNWTFDEIADRAAEIAAVGYGAVLFPPPLYSEESGTQWWQRYQPVDYRVVRSHLGGLRQLQRAIESLHACGVRCIADIVFNHMANEIRDDRFCFPGSRRLERYRLEAESFESDRLFGDLRQGLFNEHDFHPPRDIVDWSDAQELTYRSLSGLPDLVLSIYVVRTQIECLSHLCRLGFDGFRVDAVKHLPIDHVNAVFQAKLLAGRYVFGEALTFDRCQNRQFLWPVLGETCISYYDFPLHQTLVRAFSPGGTLRELVNPEWFGNALPPLRAVTFAVTHDVPNNEGFRGMLLNRQDEHLAYAYLLGRDGGVPMIYADHGESACSHPEDRGRWENVLVRPDLRGMLEFHNRLHGTSQRCIHESDHCIALTRGNGGLVAINKSDRWAHFRLSTQILREGDYRCTIHGHRMHLPDSGLVLAVGPRSAQMWIRED